jgi:hypothetical protein
MIVIAGRFAYSGIHKEIRPGVWKPVLRVML